MANGLNPRMRKPPGRPTHSSYFYFRIIQVMMFIAPQQQESSMKPFSFYGMFLIVLLSFQGVQAQPINPTKEFARHKGFMVFINWYYLQDAPMIITKHFRQTMNQGPLKRYKGSYGAFHNIDVTVCRNKITEILAKTRPMAGGIDSFLKTWLEGRLYQNIDYKQDNASESVFLMTDPAANSGCASLARNIPSKRSM